MNINIHTSAKGWIYFIQNGGGGGSMWMFGEN
jgi:hypothetical protein